MFKAENTETVSNPHKSKFSLVITTIITVVLVWGFLYVTEFAPAKSWTVEHLAKCTNQLNDEQAARNILSQVKDQPTTGKISRLNNECDQLVEEERSLMAMEQINEAKQRRNLL